MRYLHLGISSQNSILSFKYDSITTCEAPSIGLFVLDAERGPLNIPCFLYLQSNNLVLPLLSRHFNSNFTQLSPYTFLDAFTVPGLHFFVLYNLTLQPCTKILVSFDMSSSTSLLPKNTKKDDHPIFLRVCHSPWISINQRFLVAGRGFIALYMTLVFATLIYCDFKKAEHGLLIPFELPNIIYLLQVIYTWTTFVSA